MSWIDTSSGNLLPLSVESNSFQKALLEWIYLGDARDLERPIGVCQLCEKINIRYQFFISNKLNCNELLVGSECINKFSIHSTDESGNTLSGNSSKKRVNRDRRKLITNSKKKRAINALVALSITEQEESFNIDSFINYIVDRGAFTPNQLSTLFWRLDKSKVKYLKSDFKITIKRNREKTQLSEMERWKLDKIWSALFYSQKEWAESHNKHL